MKVYCKNCKNYEPEEYRRNGYFAEDECKSRYNGTKRNYIGNEITSRPEDLNKNNDCKWYEKKDE